jgi:iron uptake system component EfeO
MNLLNRLSIASCLLALGVSGCNSQPSAQTSDTTMAMSTPEVAIAVTNTGCEPKTLTVSAGKNTFLITNNSDKPLEWEILDGVKVLDERENIAPGFKQKLTTDLEAGQYDMGCGLRSNPKGQLTVQESGTTQAKVPAPSELVGPIAEYKVYILQEIEQLVVKNKQFTDAVIAGDLTKAKDLYAPTRVHWERAEPIAELFADLDGSMDAREDDFAKKTDDPNFTGFHRLELILFEKGTTDGAKPYAEKLMADTLDLQKRIKELTIEPKNMVGGAAVLIEEVAATKISGEEDRYSHTDLWDFQANIDGSQKIVDLLRPLLKKANAPLLADIDQQFGTVNQTLQKYATPNGGFVTYDKLTDGDRKNLQASITSLAEDLAKLRGTLGIN